MGSKYTFTCPNCSYETRVSGGRDVGMLAVVQTVVCEEHQELVDVLIGHHGQDGPMGDPEFDRDLHVCGRCGKRDHRPWPATYPCPRCDGNMVRDEQPDILWD